MNRKSTLLPLSVLILSAIIFLGNSSGALPEHTGAPSESTCGRSSCHNIQANQGGASIAIDFSGGAENYAPGETHTVQVSISQAQNANKNGFQIVALDSDNNNVGEWVLTDANATRLRTGTTLSDRNYVTHTSAGNSQASWSIDWKAPDQDAGTVTFYLAVLDANGNGSNSEDMLYTTSKQIASDVVSSVQTLDDSQISIYPNPAADFIFVRTGKYSPYSYQLFDLQGRSVLNQSFRSDIPVGHLDNGTYLLKVIAAEGVLSRKIQVLK